MATFVNKPASYTVNTGHAKCPNHLYMFNEGSGTPVDEGKSTHIDLSTSTGSPVWGTADLGGGGPASSKIVTFDGITNTSFKTPTSFSSTTSLMFVGIYKTAWTSPPAVISALRC